MVVHQCTYACAGARHQLLLVTGLVFGPTASAPWRRRIRHFGVCAVHIVLHVPGRDTDLLQDVQSHRRGTMPADDVVHLPRNDDSTRIVHRLRVPGVLHDLCRGVDDRPIHGMGAATDGAHA